MAAPTNTALVKKALANSEPSTHGPSRPIAALQFFGRYWGTADIGLRWRREGSVAIVESRGGISPPRAPRTVREPLDSHGSRCSAVAIT